MIYAWDGDRFMPFQAVPTVAAKQWKHWRIGERHFLGLAQGVVRDGVEQRDSVVFEWDGTGFSEFQRIPSRWAYNWHPLWIADSFYVAHAEHAGPSVLYRWDGSRLVSCQVLAGQGGRAFATFTDGPATYLVAACISAPSRVLRWDGTRFDQVQVLDGLGARELAVVRLAGRILVIRVNFILGSPQAPHPELTSHIYAWTEGALRVSEFPTCGGTDVAVLSDPVELVVANSLTPELRFATTAVRYSLSLEGC
jgi:hypothetical protein